LGQGFIPGLLFTPCEKWCRECGFPVETRDERLKMRHLGKHPDGWAEKAVVVPEEFPF
jgi:hypothetical protein